MSEALAKVIYLTKAQYQTLAGGGTITNSGGSSLTGINENYLYFLTDETISIDDLGDVVMPVPHGGTGRTAVTAGSVLIGNGTAALSEMAATSLNTANTLVQRDNSGNFSAGKATLTTARIGSIDYAATSITGVTSIIATGGYGLMGYKVGSATGVTSSQWYVGAVDCQGVIRSSTGTDLLHARNSTLSTILDTGNHYQHTWALDTSGSRLSGATALDEAAYGVAYSLDASTTQTFNNNPYGNNSVSGGNVITMRNYGSAGNLDWQFFYGAVRGPFFRYKNNGTWNSWRVFMSMPYTYDGNGIGGTYTPVYMRYDGVPIACTSPSVQINLASTSAATIWDSAPRPGVTGKLGVGNGGTGQTSWTKWGVLYASDTTTLTNTAQGATGTALMGKGAAAPAFVSVNTTLTHTAGTSSAASKLQVSVLGVSSGTITLTTASTSAYGMTKLVDGITSTSTTLAATGAAAKAASEVVKQNRDNNATTKWCILHTADDTNASSVAETHYSSRIYSIAGEGTIGANAYRLHLAYVEKCNIKWNNTNNSVEFVFMT